MRRLVRRMRQRIAAWYLRDRAVFAVRDIVKRGDYVPRGSNGRVAAVRPNGDYEVVFYRKRELRLAVSPADVALSPSLQGGGARMLKSTHS